MRSPLAVTIARIIVGLVFFGLGLLGFLPFHPPPQPGLAGQFLDVLTRSGWYVLVDGTEVLAGALLLANRFVAAALAMLAALLANILAFHITMMPRGLALPLVVTALWAYLVVAYRSYFAPLFVQRPQPWRHVEFAQARSTR